MKRIKLKHIALLSTAPLLCVGAISTPIALMATGSLRAVPTKVTLQSILGVAKTITHPFEGNPSDKDILDYLESENTAFKYKNEVSCSTPSNDTCKVSVKSDSIHYDLTTGNEVNVTYSVTNGRTVAEFFDGNTTFNITQYADSTGVKYFPNAKPTEIQLLQAIANYKSGSDFINTNQLRVENGNAGITWNKSLDCYVCKIKPIANSNFYSSSASEVTLQFNASRTAVTSTSLTTTSFNMDYPPEGEDPEAQEYMVLKNGNMGTSGSAFYNLFNNDNAYDDFTWTNKTTLTPKFTLSGNENYTTKTGGEQQTQTPVTITITTPQQNLTDLIKCYTYQQGTNYNKYLAPQSETNPNGLNQNPQTHGKTDIIFALSQGGATGNAPIALNAEQLVVTGWTITGKTGTVVLNPIQNSSLYSGSITISFSWA